MENFKFDYGSKTLEEDIKEYYTYAAANACIIIPEIAGNDAYVNYYTLNHMNHLWEANETFINWCNFYDKLIAKREEMIGYTLKIESIYKNIAFITSGNISRTGLNLMQTIYPLIINSVCDIYYNDGDPIECRLDKKVLNVGYTITNAGESAIDIDIDFFDSYGENHPCLIKLKKDSAKISLDFKIVSIHDLSDMNCEISDAYIITDESFSKARDILIRYLLDNHDLKSTIMDRVEMLGGRGYESNLDIDEDEYYYSIEDAASTIAELAIVHLNVALCYDDFNYRPFCKELTSVQKDALSRRRYRIDI